jgi:hypothetical protein
LPIVDRTGDVHSDRRQSLIRDIAAQNDDAEREFLAKTLEARRARRLFGPKAGDSKSPASAALAGKSYFTSASSRRARWVVPQGLLDTARDWASQQIIANTRWTRTTSTTSRC